MAENGNPETIPYEGNKPFNDTCRKTDTWILENESRLKERFPGLCLTSAQGQHKDDPHKRVVAILAMAENPSLVDAAMKQIEEEVSGCPWPSEPPMVVPMSGADYVRYRERYGKGGADANETK